MIARRLSAWLWVLVALLLAMVALGGITRLTQSGLSIVEWKPISGIVPPLNAAAWEAEFERYKSYPQYVHLSSATGESMSLDRFKQLFFWEYLHRLVGRLLGLFVIGSTAVFAFRGWLSRKLAVRLGVIVLLGGAQGALGWFMVKSGLVAMPQVSHFRLAAHLSLALFLVSLVAWLALDLRRTEPVSRSDASLRLPSAALLGLVAIQIVYGAFTAGLRAGHWFNTFPLMGDAWLPAAAWIPRSAWGFVENPVMVQFLHRTLAWSVLVAAIGLWAWTGRTGASVLQQRRAAMVGYLVMTQFALGIATLLLQVPVVLGVLHQLCAGLVLVSAVALHHSAVVEPAAGA